jgi:Predicted redox protein, regulator of disulfide bond formation
MMNGSASIPPIVVTHEEGLRFSAQVRSHQIVTDQPERAHGTDTGPTPMELLGAALGSCIALYVQQFCQVRDLPFEGMKVEVRHQSESNPSRIGKFFVRLVMPEQLPPQYAILLSKVARSCPVHNTLLHGAGIAIDIVTPISRTLTAVAQNA